MDDLISRQAAIDSLGERPIVWSNDDEYALGERNQYDIDRLAIETLPSAQSEPLKIIIDHELIADELERIKQAMRNTPVMLLPPIQPEQKWIPCSERLPMNRDWYLGIFREPDTGWINPIPYVCDYVGERTRATTGEGWILHHCTDQDIRYEYYYKGLQCVAWMPLPEPFRKEGDE